jgi:hypothetical protein
MSIDEFYEWTMRTVARKRGVPYDKDDMTLRNRITIKEATVILGRSRGQVYNYVCEGLMKRANDRSCYYAEFDASEIVRCAKLIRLIRDPQIPTGSFVSPRRRPSYSKKGVAHAH